MKINVIKHILGILGVLSLLISIAGVSLFGCASVQQNAAFAALAVEEAKTEDDVDYVDADQTASLAAAIYSDATYENKVLDLTASGGSLSGWDYDTDRYLKVEISGLDGSAQYQLVISMQPILYLNVGQDPTLTNAMVTYIKNENISANQTAYYEPKTYSLQNLTYLFNVGTSQQTVTIPLRYDNALWNKLADAALGDGITPLLTVKLQKVDGSDATDVGDVLTFAQATAGVPMNNSTAVTLYDASGNHYAQKITMAFDETARLAVSQMQNSGYDEGHYYRDLVVTLTLPTATIGAIEYVMNYEEAFPIGEGTADYKVTRNGNVVTFTFGNTYYQKNTFANITFSFPKDKSLQTEDAASVFSGKINVHAHGKDLISQSFTVTLDNSTEPSFESYSTSGRANIHDLETVQHIGSYALGNLGGDSEAITVRLDFDIYNTNAVGVTTVRIMSTRLQETITIRYTLMDKAGNVITDEDGKAFEMTLKNPSYNPSSTSDNNFSILFTRADLANEAHRVYYFKSLEYDIEKVRKDTKLTNTSALSGRSNGGTIWGYIFTKNTQIVPKHTGKLLDRDGDEILTKKNTSTAKTFQTNIDSGTSPSYGIDSAYVSAANITAGNTVTIGGRIFVIEYPYSSCNCLNDIRIGLLLPVGVSVNEDMIKATFANKTELDVESVTKQEQEYDGKYFWIIQFKSGEKIGYANERNGAIANGSSLSFSVMLNTAPDVATQTLNLREIVFAAGTLRKNSAGGSYQYNAVADIYDLNANGDKTDKVGRFNEKTEKSISIEAVPASLEITSEIRKTDGNESGTSAVLDSYADSVVYDLNIQNTSGGVAKDFFYLVPIKTTVIEENFLVKSEVPLMLSGIPTVNTKNGTSFEIYYITKADIIGDTIDYETGKKLNTVTWRHDWNAVSLTQAVTLSDNSVYIGDIVMLKIVPMNDDSSVAAGTDATISMPMDYALSDMEYIKDAGSEVIWCSRGYYNYSVGANTMAGDIPSNQTSVVLQVKIYIEEAVVLTAATDPGDESTSYMLPLKDADVPYLFEKDQTYRIGSIETTNITLAGSDETISASEANYKFGIEVNLKGTNVVSQDARIKNIETKLGYVPENTAVDFIFNLHYMQAISDIATPRTVHLILLGSNGVVIDLHIRIDRKLTPATAGQEGIRSDKHYSMFNVDQNNKITITADSAFTVQFSRSLVIKNYAERMLIFGEVIPEGMTIVMVDWTDTTAPKYYYYITQTSDQRIALTSFVQMGTSNHYVIPSGEDATIDETFLFIVDMNGISLDTTVSLLTKKQENAQDIQDIESGFAFASSAPRNFTLSASEVVKDSFTLAYTTDLTEGISDTYYQGNLPKSMALVISAADGETIAPDACLIADNQTYYLNTSGQFIIPLGSVQTTSSEKEFRFVSESVDSVLLKAELWVSATDTEEMPFSGSMQASVSTIKLQKAESPAFKVTAMSLRLLHRADLASSVTLKYMVENVTAITLEIQAKTGDAYITKTDVLNMLDGSADHENGVFRVQNDGELQMKFSENMPMGTYRILFTAESENETITIPYNFLVAD